MGKVKAFTAVKQPMQSKELHKKLIHFLLTNDSTARLPFQRIQRHVQRICMYTMIVPELESPLRHKQEKVMINDFDCALKPKTCTKTVQASMKSIVLL